MKKSVLIVIAVIYVAAILVIGFFGMKTVVYEEIVYVTQIEITNEEMYTKNGENRIRIYYDENGLNGVQLSYKVTPTGATNKTVSFIYDTSLEYVTVSELGAVVFTDIGAVTVQLKATDGSTASTSVTIYCY